MHILFYIKPDCENAGICLDWMLADWTAYDEFYNKKKWCNTHSNA